MAWPAVILIAAIGTSTAVRDRAAARGFGVHKSLLLVYTDIDEEHEDAFNVWYDTVHLPDLLAIDGFLGARRYKLSGPAPRNQQPASRYLAVYELASDDTRAVMKRLGEEVARLGERGMYPQMRVDSAATYVALGDRQTPA